MDFDNLNKEQRNKLKSLMQDLETPSMLQNLDKQNKYVDEFIKKKGIKVTYAGAIEWHAQPGISKKNLLSIIHQEFYIWCASNKISSVNRLNKGDLSSHLDLYIHNQRAELIRKLRSKIGYHEKFDDGFKEFDRFMDALLPNADVEKLKFARTCLHSFIWQVKRKVAGMDVSHHIMPIFYSGNSLQGVGKSHSVEYLVNPLREFTMQLQLSDLSDSFKRKSFGENYIVVFDEMIHAGKTDIDTMKNAITAKFLTARGMHTQDIDHISQNCTFIGTSNRRVQDMIFDVTGMRRFVEIEFTENCDLEVITGQIWKESGQIVPHECPINFLQIWRSVDERKCNPIMVISQELLAHQKTLTTQTMYEQWIEDMDLVAGAVEANSQQLFTHYKDWCEAQGKKPGMKNRFNREIIAAGIPCFGRKMVQGKRDTIFGLEKPFLLKKGGNK